MKWFLRLDVKTLSTGIWLRAFIKKFNLQAYAAYALAGVCSVSPAYLLLPTLTEHLTREEFAKTTLTWATIALAGPLLGFGATNSASVRYFKLPASVFAGHVKSILFLIFTSFGVYLVLGVLLGHIFGSPIHLSKWEFAAVAIIVLLSVIGQLYASLAVVSARSNVYLAAFVSYGSLTCASVYIFVVGCGLGFFGFLAGLTIGMIVFSAVGFMRSAIPLSAARASVGECRSAVTFGAPLMLHSIAIGVMTSGDRFIIAGLVGLPELASYSVIAQFALITNFVAHSLVKGVQPTLYKWLSLGNKDSEKSVSKIIGAYSISILFLSLLVGFATPVASRVIVNNSYQMELSTLWLLIIGGFFGSLYLVLSLVCCFHEKTGKLALITVASSLFHLVLCSMLTSAIGVKGAALSYAVSSAAMALFTFRLARLGRDSDS